jgi:phage tail protein X
MQAPFTQLICDRCGSDASAGPENAPRFTFCPSCRFFVCDSCWVPERELCRGCAQPGLPPPGDLKRAIRDTLLSDVRLRAVMPPRATGLEEAHRIAVRPARTESPQPQARAQARQARVQAQPSRARLVFGRALSAATADLPFRLAIAVILILAIATGVWMLNLSAGGRGAAPSVPVAPTATIPLAEHQEQGAQASAPAPVPTFYVVRAGDTLRAIARQFYADENAWEAIYAANRTVIPNPDSLEVGTRLTIPPAN